MKKLVLRFVFLIILSNVLISQVHLKLISPNGGEKLEINKYFLKNNSQIEIDYELVPDYLNYYFEYSTNSGIDWKKAIIENQFFSKFWRIPDTPSDSCLFKLVVDDTIFQIQNHLTDYKKPNEGLHISFDGSKMLTFNELGFIRISTINPLRQIDSFDVKKKILSLSWSADLKSFVCLHENNEIIKYDLIDKDSILILNTEEYFDNIAFSPDNSMIAAVNEEGCGLVIWNSRTGAKVYENNTVFGWKIFWSPNSKFVATNWGACANIIDLENDIRIDKDILPLCPLLDIRWSNDCSKIALLSQQWNGFVDIVIADYHDSFFKLDTIAREYHAEWAYLDWSPNDSMLVIADDWGYISIWDVYEREKVYFQNVHNKWITYVKWFKDSNYIITKDFSQIYITSYGRIYLEDLSDSLFSIVKPGPFKSDIYKLLACPNVADEISTIYLTLVYESNVTINLYSLVGELIISQYFKNLQPGEYKFPMDIKTLSTGSYFCLVQTNRDKQSVKIQKSRGSYK